MIIPRRKQAFSPTEQFLFDRRDDRFEQVMSYFDVTEVDGRFRLENIPAGTYTVAGWYHGETRITRSVTVPANAIVDLELVVP